MALKYLVILLIVPAIFADIKVRMVVSDKEAEQAVELAGVNEDIISDTERQSFHLSDNELKNAVNIYFGSRPDDVFVKSPTPWGDLYKSYGWDQVKRILTPVRARVLGVSSQPTIVANQTLRNDFTSPATFTASVSQNVENRVTSSWTKGGELTVGQSIEYGVDFEVASASGKTSFSYSSQWGEGVSKSESYSVGSESGVKVELQPGQTVIAELYVTRGTMDVQVDYEATLVGNTAINYGSTFKGHHFWSLDINDVMNAGGLSTTMPSSEVIKIGYYSNSHVVIRDPTENTVLLNVNLI